MQKTNKAKSENPIEKWARRSASKERLSASIALARPELAILQQALDQQPWLLNCLNGTIDLKTGKLQEANRDHYITKTTGIRFDAEAEAPTWLAFLDQIFAGNKSVINYVRRFCGYSLTGCISEQCLAFLHGEGANGKTTFVNTVRAILGDYAQEAAPDLLLDKRYSGIPNDIARMRGARFVSITETADGRRFDEGTIKRLTGGDKITARFLRAEFFEFDPSHKLWLVSNHKPEIKGTDHAIWRRIKLIPFDVIFPKAQQDPDLPEKLKKELPGILAWAVQGCLEWQQDGLQEPDEVKAATRRYKNEMDQVQRFIDDCCLVDPTQWTTARALYDEYKRWAAEGNELTLTQQKFGRQLTEKGFVSSHKTAGSAWQGICLRIPEQA